MKEIFCPVGDHLDAGACSCELNAGVQSAGQIICYDHQSRHLVTFFQTAIQMFYIETYQNLLF